MKRFIFISFWGTLYVAAVTVVGLVAVVGVLELRIGPVVWTIGASHGVHAGDVVIATIAGFLVTLFTVGLVLAVREIGGRQRRTG